VRLEQLLKDFHNAVHIATGDPEYFPNPKSPRDKGELFFNRLKLVGRGTATDKANIKRMLSHAKTPDTAKDVLNKLSVYTKAFKFYSVYANSKIDDDGRARCEYKQFGTTKAPGRLSSAQAPWGSGLNLQTVPAQAYPMFICEPGYCLIYFDLEQAEARVVGWLAGIQKWIDDFEKARIEGNFDCHRSLAADMWNMPYDEVPKEDKDEDDNFTLRYLAKRCLPPFVDVLTKRGWISIAEAYRTKEAIAVWYPEGPTRWEVPSDWYIGKEEKYLIEFSGKNASLVTTSDHRMLVYDDYKLIARPAEAFFEDTSGEMITGQYIIDRVPYNNLSITKKPYQGYVYCPTVSSQMFLVKHNGAVSVTLNCRHGLNYRMQIMKLAETTGLSLQAAADAYNRYHRINPELRRWWQATEQQATKTKTLYNLYGRRWVLTELITEQTLESIVAFVPQSTIGDKVNRVIYMAEEDDAWPADARIALNIHDALIGIAPIEKADTCLRILRKHAEEPLFIPNQPPLIIPAALKKTKKATTWRVVTTEQGKEKVEFYDDETRGFHRWSELSKVALD